MACLRDLEEELSQVQVVECSQDLGAACSLVQEAVYLLVPAAGYLLDQVEVFSQGQVGGSSQDQEVDFLLVLAVECMLAQIQTHT